MSKTYVLYHDSCTDGFCAAWIAHRVLEDSAEYIPVQYGQLLPDMESGGHVYILDFSYPAPMLLELTDRMDKVVVLDHHKSAAKALSGLEAERLSILFDMSKSGAMLAWEYFHSGERAPLLVKYVQDRDLWEWKLPHSREISAALGTMDMTFEGYDDYENWLECEEFQTIVGQGASILKYQAQLIERVVKHSVYTVLAETPVRAVNTCLLQSEIGEAILALYPEVNVSVMWYCNESGDYIYSLRGIDVDAIAGAYGGGGHAAAAGFKSREKIV